MADGYFHEALGAYLDYNEVQDVAYTCSDADVGDDMCNKTHSNAYKDNNRLCQADILPRLKSWGS